MKIFALGAGLALAGCHGSVHYEVPAEKGMRVIYTKGGSTKPNTVQIYKDHKLLKYIADVNKDGVISSQRDKYIVHTKHGTITYSKNYMTDVYGHYHQITDSDFKSLQMMHTSLQKMIEANEIYQDVRRKAMTGVQDFLINELGEKK
jgi:hypothetical protein